MQNENVIAHLRGPLLGFAVLNFAFGILFSSSALAADSSSTSSTRTSLRKQLLELINADRVRAGLTPVQLDADASAIADRYCETQIRERTTGHFSRDGLAPYLRYSFGGGYDGVSENAAAWSATHRFSDQMLPYMVRRSHRTMMLEVAPHDGHRRTILDPFATHVGLGFAWSQGEFRIAEEFLRRYITFLDPVARQATLDDRVLLRGRPVPGFSVETISVYFEKTPRPLERTAASSIESYGLPRARRDYHPRLGTVFVKERGRIVARSEEYAGGGKGDFLLGNDGLFEFPIPFLDGPGIYTVVVWLRTPHSKLPVNASTISIAVKERNARQRSGR